MLAANKGSFIPSFPIYMPFISFFLSYYTSVVLNRSGDWGYPYLPDFGRKAFSCSPINTVFPVAFLEIIFLKLRTLPTISNLQRIFIMKECFVFSNAPIGMIVWVFVFLMVVHTDLSFEY